MNRATMTVQNLVRPANTYASLPAAKYEPRQGTVGDLEELVASQEVVERTRAFLATQRAQRAERLNKVLGVALGLATAGLVAALAVVVI